MIVHTILILDYWAYILYNREWGKKPTVGNEPTVGLIDNANQELKKRGRKTAQKGRECKYVANKSHNPLLRCMQPSFSVLLRAVCWQDIQHVRRDMTAILRMNCSLRPNGLNGSNPHIPKSSALVLLSALYWHFWLYLAYLLCYENSTDA